MSARPPLLTRPFRVVVSATLASFVAFGATLPVLPRFVVDELGYGELAVGMVFGVHALAAVLIRPVLGRIGDRRGRRRLVALGGALTVVALLGHLAVGSLAALLGLRALAGVGQAAVVVGTATRALDLAPRERYGEASSFLMVAVQLGFGLGPLLGELLLARSGYGGVWIAGAVGGLVVVLAAALMPAEELHAARVSHRLLHPAAIGPGVVLGIGSLGFIGFLAFAPLHAEAIGLATVGPLFLVCSGTIVAVRLVGARIPDQLGAVPAASSALLLITAGLLGIGLSGSPAGLYLSALLLAAGTAVFAPAMALAAMRDAADGERAQVMATFTLFLDLASAVGPALLGVAATSGGLPLSFLATGAAAVIALVLLRSWLAPRLAVAPLGGDGQPTPPASGGTTPA